VIRYIIDDIVEHEPMEHRQAMEYLQFQCHWSDYDAEQVLRMAFNGRRVKVDGVTVVRDGSPTALKGAE
jgi:hypothetical protein